MFSSYVAQDQKFDLTRFINNIITQTNKFYNDNDFLEKQLSEKIRMEEYAGDVSKPGEQYHIYTDLLFCVDKLKSFFIALNIPFEERRINPALSESILIIKKQNLQKTDATYKAESKFLFKLHESIAKKEHNIYLCRSIRESLLEKAANTFKSRSNECHFYTEKDWYQSHPGPVTFTIAVNKTWQSQLHDVFAKSHLNNNQYLFSSSAINDGHPKDCRVSVAVTQQNKEQIRELLNTLALDLGCVHRHSFYL